MSSAVFPELLAGRDDGDSVGAWSVLPGTSMRGGASCNITERILEVPLGGRPVDRVVRAHELMHARVSPNLHQLLQTPRDIATRALECAEELRINTLLERLNFNVILLRDGTERRGGERLGEEGAWPEALCFFLAVLGTGAEREYLAGLKKTRGEWNGAFRAFRRRVVTILSEHATSSMAATHINEEGLPEGYAALTVPIARLLTQTMAARPPLNAEDLRSFKRSLTSGARRPATGVFAPLVLEDSSAHSARPLRASIRRNRPAVTGTSIHYPSRLLTDPQRRAFRQRRPARGGVVVIDQSGSMELSERELRELVRAAPDALILGYSHRPGDLGETSNAWVLARRGVIAQSSPSGNVGNGVDGPVLRWALRQRRQSEAFIWVTDGQVTDSHDHPSPQLTKECADMVRQHRIRLVGDVTEVPSMLRKNQPVARSQLVRFGRLGREIRESPMI